MIRPSIAKIGNNTRWRAKPCRKLARAMMATWPHSAEAMALDLADEAVMGVGNTIHISTRTASNWRNGTTGPTDADGQNIRKAILTISEQHIAARRALINSIRG